jgi:hypothetical protein
MSITNITQLKKYTRYNIKKKFFIRDETPDICLSNDDEYYQEEWKKGNGQFIIKQFTYKEFEINPNYGILIFHPPKYDIYKDCTYATFDFHNYYGKNNGKNNGKNYGDITFEDGESIKRASFQGGSRKRRNIRKQRKTKNQRKTRRRI